MKKFLSILLVLVLAISAGTAVFATDEDVVLTITPNITSAEVSAGTIDVMYTVKVTPASGKEVGSIGFTFDVPTGMTLASNDAGVKDGDGYWVNLDELEWHSRYNPTGIFENISYTPDSKYFTAFGTSADRDLNSEANLMTIKATIDASKAGSYTLGFIYDEKSPKASDWTGDATGAYTVGVVTTPVVIAEKPKVPSALTTDIAEKKFIVGRPTEFTFTTVANDDSGEIVIGTSNFSDAEAIEKLEYFEVATGTWFELIGDAFGSATGFPMSDATSKFRVTFNKAGDYTFTASMKTVASGDTLCDTNVAFKVLEPSKLVTDIASQKFIVGREAEFTLEIISSGDSGETVIGLASFSDAEAVEKLEYYDVSGEAWQEFTGNLGNEAGFVLEDKTIKFRVIFNKAGVYNFTANMKKSTSGDVLCEVFDKFEVLEPSKLTTDIGEKSFKVGFSTEFTFTTEANGDAGVMVVGTSNFSNAEAIEKLEYFETTTSTWMELTGDAFGPATGFPMSDATSKFRVTFKTAGEYTFTASMKTVDGEEVLCDTEVTFTVAPKIASELTTDIAEKSFKVGFPTEFTFTTKANDDAGVMVVGTSNFSDAEAIEKLEYFETTTSTWMELTGDAFGPATGFPMSDATSKFRVTFKKAGTYTFTASMKTVDGEEVLCDTEVTFTVAPKIASELTTDIAEKSFKVGEATEFTFTTKANDDAGVMVIGTSNFSDAEAIEKLEYFETQTSTWMELTGDFGPATGFPMSDATSKFRVTFKKAGTYTFTASMKTVASGDVLCDTEVEFTVTEKPKISSKLTTDIAEKSFKVGEATEFTFTTVANDDAGVMVIGTSNFSDAEAIEKLEYFETQTSTWMELTGDFGPATGFPMSDATSKFRVTFKKAGTYTFTASMKTVASGDVLCDTEVEFTVAPLVPSKLTTDIGEKTFKVGEATEFTFSTIANDDAGIMVVGTSNFSDAEAIEKLEYYEVKDGKWYELSGDAFGPATGFPMSDATSKFRVTFKKAGTYKFTASMKTVASGEVLCDTEVEFTVKEKTPSVVGGGGGGGATTNDYKITVKQNENGTISPETLRVKKGEDQTFEIKANEGYEIEDVLVDGKSVGAVEEYTFEDVRAKHTIEAKFKKIEEVEDDSWKNPFEDVSENEWFYETVKYANENKLFNGVSNTEFGPDIPMTRAMLVTVLYRLENEPATNKSIPFADVDMSMYYASAVIWAKQNNIVKGIDENNFAPNAQITREQLTAILYRFAQYKGIDVSVGEETNILSYDDVSEVAEYAIPAMQWACGSGIITGRTTSTLAPKGTATRAEVATMIMRFIEKNK